MDCRNYQQALEASIESRLPLEASTREHVAHCQSERCQELWQETLLLAGLIPRWADDVPQVNLTHRVLAELEAGRSELTTISSSSPRPARGQPAGRGVVSVVVAAVTVACLLLVVSFRQVSRWDDASPLAAGPKPTEGNRNALATTVEAAPPSPLQEFGVAYADWMRGATARVSSTVAFVLPEEEPPAGSEPRGSWFGNMGEHLQPLEESINRTLRLFIDAPDTETGERTS